MRRPHLPHPLRTFPSVLVGDITRYFIAMQVFGRRAAGALQIAARRQSYSTATSGYAATAENLRINKDTKVIFQGFTGKQGRCVIRNGGFVLIATENSTASTQNRPLTTVFLR